MTIYQLTAVAVGGAVGAVARFSVGYTIANYGATGFPWATLIVNILGCFLLGAFYEAGSLVNIAPHVRSLVAVGVLGALTTFSTFVVESLVLLQAQRWSAALINVAGSVVIGVVAAAGGMWVARLAFRGVSRLVDSLS